MNGLFAKAWHQECANSRCNRTAARPFSDAGSRTGAPAEARCDDLGTTRPLAAGATCNGVREKTALAPPASKSCSGTGRRNRLPVSSPWGPLPLSFDRDVDPVCRASIDAENQGVVVRRGQTFGQAQVHLIHPDETGRGPGVFDRDVYPADSARDIR